MATANPAETLARQLPALSVIIPTYNEREAIGPTLDRTIGALEAAKTEYEIIVVDDDSPDATWQYVGLRYPNDPRVGVVRRVDERGLGTAVCRGFDVATNRIYVVMDADGQHPPEAIPELLRPFVDGADIVIGSRYTRGGSTDGWAAIRRAISAGAILLANLAIPESRGIADPISGFFAVRASALADSELSPKGYKILLEVLAHSDGQRVVEVPIAFEPRENGDSKLGVDEYVAYLRHLVHLRVRA